MEQIVVTRRNGERYNLSVKKDATVITSAKQTWALMGDDVVNITVESPYPQQYEIGDSISVFGRNYKLNRLPRVKKDGEYDYTYDLTFEGIQYDLLRVFYELSIETTGNTLQDVQGDSLTGDLARFAAILVSNANRVYPNKWRLGSCPTTIEDKTLSFGEQDNCLSVFQSLCEAFSVEGSITQDNGVYTINFHEEQGILHPFVFEFGKGKGLYSIERQNVDSSNIVTRLKVYGSTDNITHKYRAHRLCLPGKTKAQSYIQMLNSVMNYGIHEACKIFEDIKPTFNGKITGVTAGNVLQFRDNSMFDLNEKDAEGNTKYLIQGVSAKIHFNTGNLAGYEFDIHEYNHAIKTFTIKKFIDDRGEEFPNSSSAAFQFAIGDEYKILDVTLPDTYINEAENKLKEEAQKYYEQNNQPKVKYAISITKQYLENIWGFNTNTTIFSPGDYLQIKDDSIGVNKAIRIQSFDRNILDEYDYNLTISDTAEANLASFVISQLIDINNIITMNNLNDPAQAAANWRSSREVMNMVFDPEGDYYTDKIKPNSIDTLALSVGAKSMQFGLNGTVFEANFGGDKNAIRIAGGTLVHYAIEETIKTWIMQSTMRTFSDDSVAYYIYAKCHRRSNAGTFVFSINPIKVDQDVNYYHFWVGVLNSVDPDLQARSIALMYGFSMINGRFITTGRIQSGDKSTYFDLDDAEIAGRINFKDGLVSGDIGVGNAIGINAGMSGAGISSRAVRFWAGATPSNKDRAPFKVLHDGTVMAEKMSIFGESTFGGIVSGITGSFKKLICVNTSGVEVGNIQFGSDGKMWFSGDMYHQGYNYALGRNHRFYSSDVWCRGSIGSNASNSLIIDGAVGYYQTGGLNAKERASVQVTLERLVSGNGVMYYNIPLYGSVGDAAGFPVDLVIIKSSSRYNYALVGQAGKTVRVVNSNDGLSQYIYCNGSLKEVKGGVNMTFTNIGYQNMIPAVSASVIGAGWLIGGNNDNGW
ncbi:phage tail protein [Porphyromonas loveana]|uniref:phage tail protein n=1 Tax=Porphyromonas loveana TaxID=1884669 RepID=UPI0035A16F5D